jgi:hypothetical protein
MARGSARTVRTSSRAAPRTRDSGSYGWLATRPLHVLAFLVPLMAAYEVGSILYLSDTARGVSQTIGARSMLGAFFDAFGVASLHLPPIVLSVVLIIWHLLERDPWVVRARVLLGMLLESVLWTLPVLVLGQLIGQGQPAAGLEGDIAALPWQARLTLSFGAGIYEELLFRLILVSAVHFVIVDLLKMKSSIGFVGAAAVSAVAFAMYHDVSGPEGGAAVLKLVFLGAAGLYFAALFIMRGFGVAVGTHALYDVVALLA